MREKLESWQDCHHAQTRLSSWLGDSLRAALDVQVVKNGRSTVEHSGVAKRLLPPAQKLFFRRRGKNIIAC
jgi:hypothetical protein